MKKILKNNIKLFLGIFIGIICSGITVYAASYLAKDIAFVPSNDNWKVSSVEEAINDLYNTKCDSSSSSSKTWDFDYTGAEQTFKATSNGTYKLEVWGAQGGNITDEKTGGYGGYSVGEIVLSSGQTLYINVGGQGSVTSGTGTKIAAGGYNGGGNGYTVISSANDSYVRYTSGGGGATHIAKVSGLLSTLENKISDIIIVSGGGSGNWRMDNNNWRTISVGSGGGYIGGQGVSYDQGTTIYTDGGTQESAGKLGYSFGGFGTATEYDAAHGGAGGGFYGGNSSYYASGGGSGYIGYANLKNKAMYCYGCTESSDESTKTVNISDVSSYPVAFHAKKNNGYARISLIDN